MHISQHCAPVELEFMGDASVAPARGTKALGFAKLVLPQLDGTDNVASWFQGREVLRWPLSCHRRHPLSGQLAGHLSQRSGMSGQQVLERCAEILYEVPAIGDLLGVRCATRKRLGVDGCPIACDDLDA